MRKLIAYSVLIASLAPGCGTAGRAGQGSSPFIRYSVGMKDARLKVIMVRGFVHGSLAPTTCLYPPDPGNGKRIEPLGLEARDMRGKRLEMEKDETCWVVKSRGRDFTFGYDIVLTIEDRYSPDVRNMLSMLQEGRCRIMGKDIFLVPPGFFADGILVDFGVMPEGPVMSVWKTVGKRMIVPSGRELATTLFISGDFRLAGTSVGETDLILAVGGDWSFGDEELLDVIKTVASREISMFGSSPRSRHLFVCDTNPVRGGKGFDFYGVHFGGSVIMLMDRSMDRSKLYDTPMAIIAHEFLHNWIGEHLRPVSGDFMWFTEGATVYFSYRVLADAGIITEEQYAARRDAIKRRFAENPMIESVSVCEAENSDLSDREMVNMFYDGGFLAAEALDREISRASSGRVRLIDVIRRIYEKNPEGADIGENDLVEAVSELTGSDIRGFLGVLVRSRPSPVLASENVSS